MQIIITGISQGLGEELFNLLSKKNVKIVALSRRFLDNQYLLEKSKNNIQLCMVDLSNITDVEKVLDELSLEDDIIFINNASKITPIDSIQNISNDDLVNSITTNFITPALIVKKLSNKKSLFIINLSTGASKRAIQNWSLYCSTKAGIEMFFNVIADDEHKNIEVVNFDPGVMNTNMQQQIRNSKFNDVDVFKSYKSKNILKDTKDVAFEIYERYIKEKIINE